MAQKLKTDWILFTTIVVMVFFGVVMLYSASSVMAQLKFGSSWHFFARQLAWMAVATMAVIIAGCGWDPCLASSPPNSQSRR
jgi:cell division protein FtsW